MLDSEYEEDSLFSIRKSFERSPGSLLRCPDPSLVWWMTSSIWLSWYKISFAGIGLSFFKLSCTGHPHQKSRKHQFVWNLPHLSRLRLVSWIMSPAYSLCDSQKLLLKFYRSSTLFTVSSPCSYVLSIFASYTMRVCTGHDLKRTIFPSAWYMLWTYPLINDI